MMDVEKWVDSDLDDLPLDVFELADQGLAIRAVESLTTGHGGTAAAVSCVCSACSCCFCSS
jgi:hypothetical protein